MAENQNPGEKTYWLDEKKNVDKIWYALCAVCLLLVFADAFYHKHVTHAVEDFVWGMYGFYGLVGCVFLVLSAKILRKIVMREEEYYDSEEPAEEPNEARDD